MFIFTIIHYLILYDYHAKRKRYRGKAARFYDIIADMLEFIRLARKRGKVADVFHDLFDLAFATLTVLLVIIFPDTPWPALALLLLSKWRMIAVRPRYWWVNIVSALPDLAFGAAIVILIWLSGQNAVASGGWALPVQIICGLIYAAWLIGLKPRDDKKSVLWQAGLAQFVAGVAIFDLAGRLPLAVIMVLAFVVAFGSAWQVLGQFEETERTPLALIYGFLVMSISFAAWHWTVGYAVTPLLEIPQASIIIAALGFGVVKLYDAHMTSGIKWSSVGWPLVASGAIIVLVTFIGGGLFV
ncbi:MAG: hypothetical protein WAW91_02985 [Candidatus Nanoperiomorbaceae bacterium]